jgi:immune inhibitor A
MKHALLLALSALVVSLAAPPPPGLFDGPSAEHLHWLQSYAEARSRGLDAPSPTADPGNPIARALAGEPMKVLILLVDFNDNIAQTSPAYFDSMGFASETFSLHRYYLDVSFGQIDIITVNWPSETGWQRAPQDYAWYVNNNYGWGAYPQNTQRLVEDVCNMVDPLVDFSVYDNTGDGFVDGVNLMFAGKFDGTPSTIWPHCWSLPSPLVLDGVKIHTFSVQNEYDNSPGDKSAAVFCHEFGHVLGLPDLYDYDYDSKGVGDWCMMSFGVYNGGGWSPAEFSPWCRYKLGVTELINVTEAGVYTVPAIETSNVAYRLWADGQGGQQYFILENRRPINWDQALPGHGLMIWHVDEAMPHNNWQWWPGCGWYQHYKVAVEQADGLYNLEHNQASDAGDPWPGTTGNQYFTADSSPDSRDYYGNDTGVFVGPIPVTSDTVQVFMSVSFTGIETSPPAAGGPGLAWSGNTFHVSHQGGHAELTVFDMAGRTVTTLHRGELSGGDHTMVWNTVGFPAGVYMARFANSSGSVSARGVVLQ